VPNNYGNDITKAGDYRINKMILKSGINETSVDVRALYTTFEVFEDLFSPYMTAKINMIDSLNLPERLPIRGQETLELEFQTDFTGVTPVKKTFKVYKIDNQTIDENGRGQQYTLHLMSEGGYYNYTERCGYSVKGKISTMVGEVFKKHFPEYLWKDTLVIQPSSDNFSFVLPQNYSPFKSITWLSKRAISGVETDYSPYLFYETLEGYRFQTLNKIIEDGEKSKDKYYFINSNVNKNPETNEGSGIRVKGTAALPGIYNKIQSLQESSRFDMIENIGSGVIASRMSVHDIVNKEKREYTFKEADVFDTMKRLGKHPHYVKATQKETNEFFEKSNSAYFYYSFSPYSVYTLENNIVDNSRAEEYFLKRKYMMNALMTQRLSVEIYGDSTKRVGNLVEVFIPKISADGHLLDEPEDKVLSGEYLITSICHSFGKHYTCKLELSRNCLGV
jgi:hypothetical protein